MVRQKTISCTCIGPYLIVSCKHISSTERLITLISVSVIPVLGDFILPWSCTEGVDDGLDWDLSPTLVLAVLGADDRLDASFVEGTP